jgi:hypothetical protein
MALASLVGERAPFFVPLVSAVVLVAVYFWLVYRWTRDPTAAIAGRRGGAPGGVRLRDSTDERRHRGDVVSRGRRAVVDARPLFAAAGGAAAGMAESCLRDPHSCPRAQR